MVTINNPLNLRYRFALSNNASQRKRLMSEVVLGRKSSVSVVNNLIATKLRANVKIRTTGINQINQGFHFVNTASAILTSVRDQLEELQNQIVSLRGADKATLQSAQIMYADTMRRIAHTLKDSQFNGKSLFDGSFADTTNAHASHCIPDDAAPLSVRYGQGRDEVINILIPRLLPGDGRKNNPFVKDTFMPLFSVTENTYKAFEALERVRSVTAADRQIVGGAQESWADAQRRLITEALPEEVNAEQEILRERALRMFNDQATIDLDSQACATFAKSRALALTPAIIFFTLPRKEIEKVATFMINTLTVAMPHIHTVPEVINLVQGIVHDHTVNNIQKVFQNIIEVRVTIGIPNPGAVLQHHARLNASINILKSLKSFLTRDVHIIVYTGSFANPNGLETSNNVINNAINNIETVLANLKMKEKNLEQALTQAQSIIIESSQAADDYLNVNYDQLIPKLLELNRQDKVAGLAFCLSEGVLNTILEQLLQIAQS